MSKHRAGRRGAPIALWIALSAAAATVACGPWFPNRIITGGDDHVAASPVADFAREIELLGLAPPAEKARPADDVYQQTIDGGVADLADALAERGDAEDAVEAIVAAYRAYREAARPGAEAPAPALDVPHGLPEQFAIYLQGAAAYHGGNMPAAREAWHRLLRLPAEQRRHRSVWAAFMLGKSHLGSDELKAIAWFERTRALAGEGFSDSIGLAAASYGWQAKAELDAGRADTALELYLAQHLTGDATAVPSMQQVAHDAIARLDATLDLCARNEKARGIITAFVLSYGGSHRWWHDERRPGQMERWIAAVERAGAADVHGAERIAWMCYTGGDYARAERWIARAGDDSPIAAWLRAKLLMRAGKLDEAAEALADAVRLLPADELWPHAHWGARNGGEWYRPIVPHKEAMAELGAIELTRGHFTEALALLLDSEAYPEDAAYIAESVLSVDELRRFVDARPKPIGPHGHRGDDARPDADAQTRMVRAILARRLARAGRWQEAMDYFGPAMQALAMDYTTAIRTARDGSLPAADRAEACWSAAVIVRHHGLALIGTALGPDWGVDGGRFQREPVDLIRTGLDGKIVHASNAELARAIEHRPQPNLRFHYRYVAADLAWTAASMMPDGTDELAARLQTAGMWIAVRDPEAADRFYKALVRRCGETALGKEADRLRWFPAMQELKKGG